MTDTKAKNQFRDGTNKIYQPSLLRCIGLAVAWTLIALGFLTLVAIAVLGSR